jgi:hypothetical protein
MKHEYKLHLIGILILAFCVSCGQNVKETVKPKPTGATSGQFKRVVIVPFADYTPASAASSLEDYGRRNVLVLEALQDALYQRGFISAAEEDVVKYLMDRGVIQDVGSGSAPYATAGLDQELKESWSNEMKEEIQNVIIQNMNATSGGGQELTLVALDRQVLNDMGDTFGADYIVRGRIIEFGVDQKDSFNPVRTGLIPFVFKSGQRTILGVAESEGYEKIDPELLEDFDRGRAFGWGAGGFVTGLFGEKQGRVRGATVQVRVLVQDASTGAIVWLNRAEVCTTPASVFAEPEQGTLLARSIEEAVNSLMNDFVSAYNSGRLAGPQRGAGQAVDGADDAGNATDEAKIAAEEAKKAARQAEAAAAEANQRSERIFKKTLEK